MVYSASAVWADYKFDDSFFFAKRQLLFAGIGVIAMFFIMNVDYWTWRTWSKLLMVICFFLLVLVLIPGVGMVRNGSRSWIGVGAFSIQPSEFMKLAMIAFLAKFFSEKQKNITSFRRGFVPALGIVFSAFLIIMCQPDLGTGTVMVGTCIVMIFVAGATDRPFRLSRADRPQRICRARTIGSISDKADYLILKSMGRPARKRISDHSIALCSGARRVVRNGARTKQTEVLLSA